MLLFVVVTTKTSRAAMYEENKSREEIVSLRSDEAEQQFVGCQRHAPLPALPRTRHAKKRQTAGPPPPAAYECLGAGGSGKPVVKDIHDAAVGRSRESYWIAVKELNLRYRNSETILFTIYPYDSNLLKLSSSTATQFREGSTPTGAPQKIK